jgi:hypothetical protein
VTDQGKTIIMVTHDDSLVPRFSRHLTITDGEIVDEIARAERSGAQLKRQPRDEVESTLRLRASTRTRLSAPHKNTWTSQREELLHWRRKK